MSRFFLLLAFAALLCLSSVSAQTCGGAGYDLSALVGTQFSYFDPASNFTYAVAPCGVVNDATACPNPNYPNTAFCQSEPGRSGTSLGQYSAENSTWYASADGKTVTQIMQDGTPSAHTHTRAMHTHLATTIDHVSNHRLTLHRLCVLCVQLRQFPA